MSWKAYINNTEVIPYNLNSTKITEYYEDYFRIRTKFSGPVVLIDDPSTGQNDFTFVKDLSFDEKHTFTLRYNGEERFTGIFSRYECELDEAESKVTFTPTLYDDLTIIQEKEDIEVNITSVESTQLRAERQSYLIFWTFSTYEAPFWTPTAPGTNWTEYYSDSYSVNRVVVNVVVFALELIMFPSSETAPSGWTVYDTRGEFTIYSRAFNQTKWAKPTGDQIYVPIYNNGDTIYLPFYDQEFQHWLYEEETIEGLEETEPSNILEFNKYESVLWTEGYDISKDKSYLYIHSSVYNGPKYIGLYAYYRSRELKACLSQIVSTAMPSFTGEIKSTLLFFDQAETGGPDFYTGYSGYEYPLNTNTVQRKVFDKYLITKSDFKKPSADQPATVGNITFKKAMDFITNRFNAKWFIDNDGNLRIEHLSYKSLQITTNYRNQDTIRNNYKYDNSIIPNIITFQDSEAWLSDFTQKQIVYGHIPAIEGEKENREEIQTSFITTDIDGANRYLDSLSDDGFVMVEEDSTFTGRVYRDTGAYSGLKYLQNVGLSWANCLERFYRHEAYKNTFTMNENETTALSLKKLKIQESVELIDVDKPNLRNAAETIIGIGEIDSMEYPCSDEIKYTAKLKYPV